MSAIPKVSALYIHPIKGCAAVEVSGVRLDARGPLLDRRFMVVDAHGKFLSQRELPAMALVHPKVTPTSLVLQAPGMQKLQVALGAAGRERRAVQIWNDSVPAETAGSDAAEWWSEYLGQPAELVRFADDVVRPVDPRYARADAQVGFADAFPLLLLSEASVEALNTRLPSRVPISRFRPNVVVTGCPPHAEDGWSAVRIGEVTIDVVKPCSRCTVITVDPATGERGVEPTATLARYRTKDHKIYFAQNCVHRGPGMLRVGDEVTVLQTQQPWTFTTA